MAHAPIAANATQARESHPTILVACLVTLAVAFALFAPPQAAYASSYKAGATKMPVKSTSTWTLTDATLKKVSGSSVKVKGSTVTAVKTGTSRVAVYDGNGKKMVTKTIKVYQFKGAQQLALASNTAQCLEIEGGSTANGGNALINPKSSAKSQKFNLNVQSDGSYYLVSANSKKYIQVAHGSSDNKANVKQWKKSGLPSQHWKIKVDAKNRLTFINAGSGKALCVLRATQNAGSNVLQYSDLKHANQKWVVSGSRDYGTDAAATPAAPAESDAGTSKSAKLTAKAMATQAAMMSYSRTVYQGEGTGTAYYMSICKKLRSNGYYAKNSKQMQCNVPVAAAVFAVGADVKFPTTNKEMYNYMKKSSAWKCLGNYKTDVTTLQPGDILIRIAGVTTYTVNGKTGKAATNHACMYVGKTIAQNVYKKALKGTDADKGKPAASAVFVSAHTSLKNRAKRSAACLEKASAAYADSKMIVFRYVG